MNADNTYHENIAWYFREIVYPASWGIGDIIHGITMVADAQMPNIR